jgi:hypothetical protein
MFSYKLLTTASRQPGMKQVTIVIVPISIPSIKANGKNANTAIIKHPIALDVERPWGSGSGIGTSCCCANLLNCSFIISGFLFS